MSKVERQKTKLKMAAKKPGAWRQIAVTGEFRSKAPHLKNCTHIWANGAFEVQAYTVSSPVGGIVQLVIARHGHLASITWGDCQRIKTELFGVENFAIEIYPAERVDADIKIRILWILPTSFQMPCGLHLPTAWGGE